MSKRVSLPMLAVVALTLLAGVLATGCSPTPGPVRVTADEFAFKLSSASAPAGKVTFDVVNQGKVEHELVILKTDLAPTALKMRVAPESTKKVDEAAGAKNLGEVEDVAAGTTKSGTFDLTPGKYLLICNVEDHYKAGMVTAFEVK